MTKEDIAEILCIVGNAILSKSKEKESATEDLNYVEESVVEETGSFEGDFDENIPLETPQATAIPQPVVQQPIQQPIQQPVTQMPQAVNDIFTPAAVSPEIQNMLQQKENQIASLQSQLSATQTSNLGFTPIKL